MPKESDARHVRRWKFCKQDRIDYHARPFHSSNVLTDTTFRGRTLRSLRIHSVSASDMLVYFV